MHFHFIRTFELGVKSLLLQKMRAGLAALGIFIGTATVIWLVAMGEGVSYRAQQQILELGATNVIVRTIEPNKSDDAANSRGSDDFIAMMDDADSADDNGTENDDDVKYNS